jgi:superfamily II DNA or RNA helicase
VKLRDYQSDAVDSIEEHLARVDATLLVLPTGTGKTVVFAHAIKRFQSRGRAMVIAHREELLDQARDKIEMVTGIRPDLEMADSRADEGWLKAPIVVSSVQTQTAGRTAKRYTRFDPGEFGLLIIDEAHHAPADTYREVITHYQKNPRLKVLGVTATPDRHDGEALGQIFDSVAFDYEITDAIAEGWLVNVTQKYLSVMVDFGGVPIVLGDFQGKALRELLAQGNIIETIASDSVQWAGDRKTLVFSDSVQNAETMCEVLNRHRLGCARIVTGETPKDERRQTIGDYRDGRFQYLCNVGVATEGFDVPDIACIVMARPTCSRSLYAQMLGRGTRPLPGVSDAYPDAPSRVVAIQASPKGDVLVLDIVGNSSKHKLITAGDILGGKYTDREIQTAEELLQSSPIPRDVAGTLEEARRRLNAEILAEAQRQESLKLKARSKSRDVDPFGVFGMMRRTFGAGGPVDEDQRARLQKWGIDIPENLDWTAAQQLVDEFRARTRRGLATYRQVKNLVRRWGMNDDQARRTPFAEASRIMQILSENNWRKPENAT